MSNQKAYVVLGQNQEPYEQGGPIEVIAIYTDEQQANKRVMIERELQREENNPDNYQVWYQNSEIID